MFSLYIVSLSPSICPATPGRYFAFPTKSSISISILFGINNSPKDAINISLIVIIGIVFPFAKYVRSAFPKQKPIITPILPKSI